MSTENSGDVFLSGLRSKELSEAGSVARASAVKMSMMMLIQSNWTAESRLLFSRSNHRDESDNDSGNVRRDLEMKKLAHHVIHAATPHNSLDNQGEIVIHENDVRCILSDFRTSDTHGKADMHSLKRGIIVCIITGDTGNLAKLFELLDEQLLVLRRRASEHL